MQTDEEMLERVLQNSGYLGNGLRHDHQQLACSSLVFMIGLPELSLMTVVSEETVSKERLLNTQRHCILLHSVHEVVHKLQIDEEKIGVMAFDTML